MADDTEQKQDGDDSKPGGIKGLLGKLPVLIGGVMVLEAVVLFAGFKMLGGGADHAAAAEGVHVEYDDHGNPIEVAHTDDHGQLVELNVLEFRTQNNQSGRSFHYDVEISVQVKSDVQEKVEERLANSSALIKDRMGKIIRSLDQTKLNGSAEPGLETLRRQVRYQLDLIVGEGLIEEVLVPRCIPYRADY